MFNIAKYIVLPIVCLCVHVHGMDLAQEQKRYDDTLLSAVADNRSISVIQAILELDADASACNKDGHSALSLALFARYKNVNQAREAGIDIDMFPNLPGPIMYSKGLTRYNDLHKNAGEIVTLLVRTGACLENLIYPNTTFPRTIFHIIAEHGDYELCKTVIDHKKKEDSDIEILFARAKTVMLIRKRHAVEKKPILPKPIIFLIFDYITPPTIKIEKGRKTYPNLCTLLEKKAFYSNAIGQKNCQITAFEVLDARLTKASKAITLLDQTEKIHDVDGQEIQGIKKVRELVNPKNYLTK